MEEERKDVLFKRSAFGGFRRNDVMRYIEQLQNELSKSKGECLKQAKLLEDYKRKNAEAVGNCMSSAKSAVEEVDRMLTAMSEQLTRVSAEKAELEKQMQELQKEKSTPVTAQTEENTAEDRIAELMEQIEDLRARLRVETAANEILTNRTDSENDDGFFTAVAEETVTEESVEEVLDEPAEEAVTEEENESEEKEVTVEEIEQIINRFLK